MSIYITIFLYVFFVGYIGKSYAGSRNIYTRYDSQITLSFAIAVLLLPVFFIGMRTNYVDTRGYIEGFNTFNTTGESIFQLTNGSRGPGWIVYEWLIKTLITKSGNTFIMITAIVQGIAVLKLYYKHSTDYAFSVLLFFLSMSFVNMMNGIRQFLAVSLIIFFADYLFDKKYIKFLIVVLLAYLIHVSAIVWIPALFIVRGKAWNKKTIFFSIAMVIAIVFVDGFTGILSTALEDTLYSGYTSQFAEDDGSNLVHTLLAAIPVVIAFYGRNTIEYYENERINILVNISLIGVMFSLLANFTSGILMGRIPIYFTIFNFALYPFLLDGVFSEQNRKALRVLCVVGYCAYAWYYMTHTWGSSGMPYISDILGINTWR